MAPPPAKAITLQVLSFVYNLFSKFGCWNPFKFSNLVSFFISKLNKDFGISNLLVDISYVKYNSKFPAYWAEHKIYTIKVKKIKTSVILWDNL